MTYLCSMHPIGGRTPCERCIQGGCGLLVKHRSSPEQCERMEERASGTPARHSPKLGP